MRLLIFQFTLFLLVILIQGQRFRPPRQEVEIIKGCMTPDQQFGECLNIRQCPKLLEILKTSNSNPQTVNFLRSSVCRFEGTDPIVCCPGFPSDKPADDRNTNPGRKNNDYPNLPLPPKCGHSSVGHSRIVGGNPAELGAWPWITALGYKRKSNANSKTEWLCGGVLVTEKHVVTAAHCLKHPSYVLQIVRVGDLDLESSSEGAIPFETTVQRGLSHPQYDSRTKANDIAIVYLRESATFSKHVQPICIPIAPEIRGQDFVKLHPFVAGWGSISFKGPSTSKLQEVQVPVVNNDDCRPQYERLGGVVTQRHLCAGYTNGGHDACQGDSGGPLMLPKNGSYYLIGVVSYGFRCAEKGYPGIYTRVTAYLDWLNQNMV